MNSIRLWLSLSLAVVAWTLALLVPLPATAQSGPALTPTSAGEAAQLAEADRTVPRIATATANIAPGAEEGWRVVVASGTVRYLTTAADGTVRWGAVEVGQVVPAETQFETAADGHLLLFNGHDSLTVSPGSRIIVPAEASPAEHIRILQDLGTVRYDVESRRPGATGVGAFLTRVRRALTTDGPPAALFEVRTPHAVVVVKGTSFTITVTPLETRIVVLEGVVAVRDLASGEIIDLLAGQSVIVGTLQEAGLVVQQITTELLDELAELTGSTGQTVESLGATVGGSFETLGSIAGGLGAGLGVPLESLGGAVESLTGWSGGSSSGGGTSGSGSSGGGSSGGSSSGSGSSGGGSSGGGGGGSVSDTVDSVSDSLGL